MSNNIRNGIADERTRYGPPQHDAEGPTTDRDLFCDDRSVPSDRRLYTRRAHYRPGDGRDATVRARPRAQTA